MRHHRIFLALANMALAHGATAQSPPSPDSSTAVDQIFAWAHPTTPGCAVGVARGGKLLLERGYGSANLSLHVPIDTGTVFDIGSVSKQFTAAAIMLLVADRKLSLDDPVKRFLPELQDYPTPPTIRQLLAHTAGFREWDIVSAYNGWSASEAAYAMPEVLGTMSHQGLNFTPGSEWSYSNTNYMLAAMIVARVSGMPFADFTRTRLFEPLGMTNTQWRDGSGRIIEGSAAGYDTDRRGGYRDRPMPFGLYGSGALHSTIGDLMKWNDALANRSVVPAALVQTMETDAHTSSGKQTNYGLGLALTTHDGWREIQHGGATSGFRSFAARYPEQRLTVVVLCNSRSLDAPELGHRVADVFLPKRDVASVRTTLPAGVQLDSATLDAAAGLYRNTRNGESVRISRRSQGWHFSGGIYFGEIDLTPLSGTSFAVAGASTGRFVTDSNGRAQSLRIVAPEFADTLTYVRVAEWHPSAESLGEYAGRYSSPELSNRLTLLVQNGQLLVSQRTARSLGTAEPLYKDAFRLGDYGVLLFDRNANGSVHGFTVNHPLARGIPFVKS